ncbi:MAG: ATP-binding protein [Bacteroidales bacterium]|nr:ATP-binding protein [Bacteroidales bacterium]
MYKRKIEKYLLEMGKHFPIISITGPRQSGKTTLCRMLYDDYDYINLEDEESRAVVQHDIKGYLRAHGDGLVIDEAHYLPELFSALQVVSDEDDKRRYVLSGSSNWLLMQNISQSLAGRVALARLLPLSIDEIGSTDSVSTDGLIYNGFYPAIWGKGRPAMPVYDGYFSTYIQRDVRQIVNIRDMDMFRKFVRLCATRVGCEFVASSLAAEVGVSAKTISEWLSVLQASYIVFLLQPYYRNMGKRLTKTPKLYFYDVGLASYLLGLRDADDVATSPLRGALFENMVVADMLKQRYNVGEENNMYFYRDKSQHEVDILAEARGKMYAYEVKSATVFHASFFRNLDYLRKIYGEDVVSTQLIYDGEQEWDKAENGFVNFRHVERE